jgi:hypothetical protein
MRCIHCESRFSPASALSRGLFSWPEMRTMYFECDACAGGNHLRLHRGRLERIRIVGAPGPVWEVVEAMEVPGLEVRDDPAFLHAWLDGAHYEWPAR